MPDDPNTPDRDREPPRATIDAEGKIEGRVGRIEPAGAPPVREAPIELVARPPPRPPYEEHGPWRPVAPDARRRLAVRLALAAAALGVVLLVGALVFGRARPAPGVRSAGFIENLLPSSPPPPMVVDSEPSGADIAVNGKHVGQTPWAGENGWAGDNELVITAPGFTPWKKKFQGHRETHLTATLKPR